MYFDTKSYLVFNFSLRRNQFIFRFNNINIKQQRWRCTPPLLAWPVGRVAWMVRQPCGCAAWQLGGRAARRTCGQAARQPRSWRTLQSVTFAVGRRSARAENTKFIFHSGGSAKQRMCSLYVVLDSYSLEAQAYSGGVFVLYIYKNLRMYAILNKIWQDARI